MLKRHLLEGLLDPLMSDLACSTQLTEAAAGNAQVKGGSLRTTFLYILYINCTPGMADIYFPAKQGSYTFSCRYQNTPSASIVTSPCKFLQMFHTPWLWCPPGMAVGALRDMLGPSIFSARLTASQVRPNAHFQNCLLLLLRSSDN